MDANVTFPGIGPTVEVPAQTILSVLARYGIGRVDGCTPYDGGLEVDGETIRLTALPAIRDLPGRRVLEASSARHVADLARVDIDSRFPDADDELSHQLFLAQRDLVLNLRRRYGVDSPPPASLELVQQHGQESDLFDRQNGRCLACGASLDTVQDGRVHLDHVIPTSLGGGDPRNMSNWRLLCGTCNEGRSNFVSAYLIPDFWGLPTGEGVPFDDWRTPTGAPTGGSLLASRRIRYAVFATNPYCAIPKCDVTPLSGKMYAVSEGLPVGFRVTVCCHFHVSSKVNARTQVVA